MVFIGWRHRKKQIAPVAPYTCPNCGTYEMWVLYRYRRWFTFMFIPIAPLGSRYHMLHCQHCETARKLDPDEGRELLDTIEEHDELKTGNLPAEGYPEVVEIVDQMMFDEEAPGTDTPEPGDDDAQRYIQ